MANTMKQDVLNSIEQVYYLAENSKLENTLFELIDQELSLLAEYFRISKSQALLFSIIFTLNSKGNKVRLDDLHSYLKCNPVRLFAYSKDLLALHEKRLIRKSNIHDDKPQGLKPKEADEEFYINRIVSEKIFKGEPIPAVLVDAPKFKDIFSLLEKIYDMGNQRGSKEISTKELFEQTQRILTKNTHFPLIKKMKEVGTSLEDKYMFLYLIWKFVNNYISSYVIRMFRGIYDNVHQRFSQMKNFLDEKSKLVQEGWVEIEGGESVEEIKIQLTEKAFELLASCDLMLFDKALHKHKQIIQPGDIPFRQLIYSEKEETQLDLLKTLLLEENFQNAQKHLTAKALTKGITVLLHGAPGTGKTESVLQMAKATHREIVKVDISESRDMWFGQSEKIIKKVFKDYKSYAKKSNIMPILFFNEADAIIAKRQELSTNTSNTENRIQNILLEEIENFEGILIATTNLVNNMDAAFERRFLFKIEFQKPSTSAKAQIWKSKMPHLSEEDCALLASQFDFSGGQIDNILRKSEINEMLHGSKTTLQQVLEFCEAESLMQHSKTAKVGF